jgi:hypothetical protein
VGAEEGELKTDNKTAKQPGWSFARLLLVVAVVGVVAGVVLAEVTKPDPESVERAAEAEIRRITPLGEPLNNKAGDSMEPDPLSMRGIPPYPGVYPRRLIKQASAQGAQMSVSWFSVQDPAPVVLDFYKKAFAAEGRDVVAQQMGENMGYVAWLETQPDAGGTAAGVLHMVSAMKQFSQTIVLVSASRPDMSMGQPVLPEGIELPPASSAPQLVQMGEESLANEVVYTRTTKTTPHDVVTFFEKQFKDRGYSILETVNSTTEASVTGQKGPLTVVVAARSEGDDSSVVLTYERRKSPQQELQ